MFFAIVMECRFSAVWLDTLCQYGTPPAAVLIAAPYPAVFLPARNPVLIGPPAVRVDAYAAHHALPLYRVRDWNIVPAAFYTPFAAAFVACYPRRLPAAQFAARGIAAWNIHPAPLPLLRGPDPLFYTARGDAPPTVTIHRLDATYDTGPIAGQTPVATTACTTEHAYIDAHARSAAALTHTLLTTTLGQLSAQREPATWAPFPAATDYLLDPTWSCARTTAFMQYTDARGHPYTIADTGVRVRRVHPDGAVSIPCADGVVRAEPWDAVRR